MRIIVIIDGHIDVTFALQLQNREFSARSDIGHVDLPRMREGNVSAALFAVYPASSNFSISSGVDYWFKLVENPENSLMQIRNLDDFEKARQSDKIGAILHFEGAGGLDSEFVMLRNFHRLGLRSMGLSWSNMNQFATGIGTIEERGLTSEGKALVSEMQSLGILVDVSHLNEKSFWDVVEITGKPIIASHSNAYSICNHVRNLKDEQIQAIRDTNGTIGINLCTMFLDPQKREEDHITFELIKKHFDHIVEKAGINHISLGSDYDGATVPSILKDISYYPKLLEFLRNTYSRKDIDKIAYQNFLRVFKATW